MLLFSLLFSLFSCESESDITGVDQESVDVQLVAVNNDLLQNVALIDFRHRRTTSTQYVHELVVKNYSNENVLPNTIYLEGVELKKEKDQDNIGFEVYVSEPQTILKANSFSKSNLISSWERPIYSGFFNHQGDLANHLAVYDRPNQVNSVVSNEKEDDGEVDQAGVEVGISCGVTFFEEDCGCLFADWGWTDTCVCINLDDCDVGFSLSF